MFNSVLGGGLFRLSLITHITTAKGKVINRNGR